MQSYFGALLLSASLLLSACAGTAVTVQSDYKMAQGEKLKLELKTPAAASEEGVAILRERLACQLSANGLAAKDQDQTVRTVEVVVSGYRMRPGAARAMAGAMAGSDNIQSTVRIKDQASGKVLSQFFVESKNSSALGSSKGLIEEHADKIVETLLRGKS